MSTKNVLNLSLSLLLMAAFGLLITRFYIPAFQTTSFLVLMLLGIAAILILLFMNNRKNIE